MPAELRSDDAFASGNVFSWARAVLLQLSRTNLAFAIEQRKRLGEPPLDGVPLVDQHADIQFLLIAANHLVTALNRCKKRVGLPQLSAPLKQAVTTLRDIYEHWETTQPALTRQLPVKGAVAKLLAAHPEATPFGLRWTRDEGMTIAGALHLPTLFGEVREIAEVSRTVYNDFMSAHHSEPEIVLIPPIDFILD